MSGKSIVIAVALIGWFFASLIAFVVVALFDFLGVAVIGVLIAFVSNQGELHSGSSTGGTYGAAMIRHQTGEQQPSPERRAAERVEHSLIGQSARFFRHFGIALAVIGFGGFAYRYL
jgi:hypothetical protein